jgi:(p)ppGpp synthase/HD superfamily hydrolase
MICFGNRRPNLSAHDASIRACRARSALQAGRQRGLAEQGLCLCHAEAWPPDARLGRSLFLASARSRRHPDRHALDEATIAVACCTTRSRTRRATREEIDELFGPDIGKLVEGLTKLKKLDLVSKKAEQAENLRKLLLAISEDVRVLLVKLADRLHNMRTLTTCAGQARQRIAEETMDIYAPLAGRMGMQDMREELEDLSFRHINPEAYRTVTQAADRTAGAQAIRPDREIEEALSRTARQAWHRREVKGRRRSPIRSSARWSARRCPSSSCPTSSASA